MKIQVKVKPNSKSEEVNGEGDNFIVKVKEQPKDGKANHAVIKLLAEYFNVPQSHIKIIGGFRGKNKIIEVIES